MIENNMKLVEGIHEFDADSNIGTVFSLSKIWGEYGHDH